MYVAASSGQTGTHAWKSLSSSEWRMNAITQFGCKQVPWFGRAEKL